MRFLGGKQQKIKNDTENKGDRRTALPLTACSDVKQTI
jgi:hypothetical protein